MVVIRAVHGGHQQQCDRDLNRQAYGLNHATEQQIGDLLGPARRCRVEKVAEVMNIGRSEVLAPGKERIRVQARSLLCYWAARELGIAMAELSRKLKISPSAVTLAVKRGEKIALESGYTLI